MLRAEISRPCYIFGYQTSNIRSTTDAGSDSPIRQRQVASNTLFGTSERSLYSLFSVRVYVV